MANQIIIDIGAVANDGTGDPLRTAFGYVNDNFSNVWATGVANSNIAFSGNKILTTNTNGNLVLAPNGTGKVQANVDIIPNANNTLSLGSTDKRWNTVYARNLDVDGNVTFAGDITISSDLVVDGNLTVNGTTTSVNTTEVDIEDKVITIAYGSPNASAANGAGINVAGANANITYNQTANAWTFNIGVSATGNITAPYFIGNGSQLTGITSYGNSNVSAYLASGTNTANIITTGNISAGNISGTFVAPGFNQDIVFNRSGLLSTASGFNYNYAGNILYAPAAGFSGDLDTGVNGLFVGHPSYTLLGSDIIGQFTGDVNAYSQINSQNISNGAQASGDIIITADNGTDSTHFLDLGMTSSTWDGTQPNSLGNRLGPNDGYLYVQDGDMIIGTNNGSIYTWKFDQAGNLTVPGNIIPATSNVYSLGNSTNQWSDLYVSNATIYMNNVPVSLTAGNVLTVNGADVVTTDANGQANIGNLDITGTYVSIASGASETIITLSPNIEGQAYLQMPNDATANVANVRLHNDVGNIELGTGSGSHLWYFDNAGNLSVPVNINFNGGGIQQTPDEDLYIRVSDAEDDGWSLYNVVDDGAGTVLGLTQLQRDRYVVQFAGAGAPQFSFYENGQMALPGNIRCNEYVDTSLYAVSDNNGIGSVELKVISYAGDLLGSNVRVTQSNAYISTANAAHTWNFDNAGTLTFPSLANISGGNFNAGTASASVALNAFSPDGNTVSIQAQGNSSSAVISIFANSGPVTNNWTFTQAELDPTEAFLYVPPGASISTPNATGGQGGKNIFIQAGASDSVTWNSNPGGELFIKGGYGSFGDGGGGPGGNVNINGGESSDSHAGNVNIASGLNTWVFDYTGDLTAPGNIATDWLNISNVGNIARLEADVLLQITTNAASNTAPSWTFNTDGTLFVPGNIAGDNNGPLIIDGNGSGIEGYISLPASNFGGEQITIVNEFTLGNGISLVTNGGEWHFGNSGAFTSPGAITATGTVSGQTLVATQSAANEGGEIQLALPSSGTTLTGNVIIDSYQNSIRFFESGNSRGMYVDVPNVSVSGQYAIGYRDVPQIALSGNVTANSITAGKHFYSTTAGNLQVTIPDNANVAFPLGATLTIVMNAAGNVIVAQGTGVSLYMAGSSSTGNRTVGAYGLASVMKVATDTWIISGTGVY